MEDLDGNPGTPLEWSDTSEFSQAVLMSPSLSINDITAAETNSGTTPFTFTVTLSNSNDQAVTVDYTVLDGTATLADNDFVAASDTLTFAPFQTSQTITVQVKGDIKYETAETFTVLLSNPTNAAIADNSLTGTITNDDSTPAMSIGDVSQAEGNSGTTNFNFTVSLSAASYQTITVNYATANGSASAPGDFTALSGALTFNPGELTKTVTVSVVGDTVQEANENFTVNLSGAVNATVTDALGVGTILNDDATISINDVSRLEGPGASQIYIFTVSLSGMSGVPVTLDYASANGTATAGSDYTAVSGSLTFTPGQLTKMIAVTVFGDLIFEPNETLFIDLTNILGAAALDSQGLGTILNDD